MDYHAWQMLYERWRQIATELRNHRALDDLASGRSWTFRELFEAGESWPGSASEIVCPRGNTAEFLLTLLAAWRETRVVCPLVPDSAAPDVPRLPSPCIHLKSTSATTGRPRLVAFTAEQLLADAENIVSLGLRRDWPNLGAISMAHSYGFSNLVLPLLLFGIPLILAKSGYPESIRQATESGRNLVVPGVPALWHVWHEAGVISRNIRLAISAGAPLPLELEVAIFKSTGIKVHNFYGSSECGGIAFDAAQVPRVEESFVGSALRNVRLEVDDTGCLRVQSAAVGETYWPAPSTSLRDGWFQTQDLGEVRNGAVRLRGRITDVINVAGKKLSPELVERMVLEHPAVGACLVFGIPNQQPERGDVVVASVVARGPVTSENLRQFLLRKAPSWQIPKHWWFVDSIDPNGLGKVSRAKWRARYLVGSQSR